jgi:hypothetical protein
MSATEPTRRSVLATSAAAVAPAAITVFPGENYQAPRSWALNCARPSARCINRSEHSGAAHAAPYIDIKERAMIET